MRAITVLICLALGRDVAASIFRQSYRPQNVQPLDYVNQQQQEQQEQQQQQQQQRAKIHKHHDKSSSESEESKERHYNEMKQYSDYQREVGDYWNSPFTTLYRGDLMPLGDVTARGQIKQESSEQNYRKQQRDENKHKKQTNSNEEDIESIGKKAFRQPYRSYPNNLNVQSLDYVNQQQRQQQEQQQQRQQRERQRPQQQQEQQQQQQQQLQQQQIQNAKIHKHHHKSSQESEESKEHHFQNMREDSEYQRQVGQNWNSPYTNLNNAEQMSLEDVIVRSQIRTRPRMSITDKQESSEQNNKKNQREEYKNKRQTNLPNSNDKDIENIFKEAFRTTQHVSDEDKQKLHEAFVATEKNGKEDVKNATEMLKKNNYGVEEHVAKTDDGYFLTMFRIKPQKEESRKSQEESSEDKKRPIVLLMHGLLGSADNWLLMGPGKSLAYKMADQGFDVWLGNTRGSKYSRRHASKHPAQSDFWKFSVDEIALHDLPTMIDHALKANQESKLYYVGHSQATTAFFALASTRPEYREKIAVMYALSPMVYMNNVRSPLLRTISPNSRYYEAVHNELGHGEFKPSKDLIKKVGGDMCESQIGCHHVCENVNFVMTGVDTAEMNTELIPVIAAHLPAGASTRQIKQYGQALAAGEFRKYDYGPTINEKVYGKPEPPKYNMTEVKVPVVLYHSEEDWMAHPKDVEKLNKELPDVREKYQVPETHFSHMDFQFSEKAPKVVNDRLIESIKKDYTS